MRLGLLPLIATWAVLLPGTLADFQLYRVQFRYGDSSPKYHWQAFESQATKEKSWKTALFEEKSDVSGNKKGVRCKGKGCDQKEDINKIEQLEMHFSNNPLKHFTIYSNRNYDMIGLDGKKYGTCDPYPHGDFKDNIPGGPYKQGARKFKCYTALTAPEIEKNKDK